MSPIEQHLQTHSRALRALARDLVGEQNADDLLQDTAVQALAAPPRRPGPVGGWLAQVVRHLASKHRRSERRRRRREQAAARDRTAPAADAAIATAETFRRLSDAVLALPETHRDTVLRRYLREQSPSEIAAELGVPLPTVKSRLQRGLEMLRERLDRDGIGADWRAGVVAAFGFERAAEPAVTMTLAGATLMSIGMKWALGGIAAALVVLATWSITADSAPPPGKQVVVASEPAAAAGALADARPSDDERTERRAVAVEPIDTPAMTTIRGRCVDEFGKPLPGCRVLLDGMANEQHELCTWVRHNYDPQWKNPAPQTTGADGRFEWQFVPHEPLRFLIAMEHPGRIEMRCEWPAQLRGEGLQPGTTVELGDIALRGGAQLRGRVVDTAGQPVANTKVYATLPRQPNASGTAIPNRFVSIDTDASGAFASAHALSFGDCKLSVYERQFRDGKDGFPFVLDDASPWVELVVMPREPRPTIRGIVVDDTGTPMAGASVTSQGGLHDDYVAADGTFMIEARRPLEAPIRILTTSRSGYETATLDGPIAWGTTDLRIVLHRGLEGELRVVDPEGRPVEEFAAWLFTDEAFPRVALTAGWSTFGKQPGGGVRIPNLRRGPFRLLVEPRRRDLEMTMLTPIVVSAPGPARLDVQLPRRAERLVRLVDSTGKPVVGSMVELIEAGIGELTESTTALPIEDLTAGDRGAGTALVRSRSTTDAAGAVRLHGPTGGHFAVRLPGPVNLPKFVSDVSLDAPQPLVITVQRGASLRVQLSPPGIGRTLAAYASWNGSPVSKDRQPQVWLRRSPAGFAEPPSRCAAVVSVEDRVEFSGVEEGTWHLVLCFMLATGSNHMRQNLLDLGAVQLRDSLEARHSVDLSHLLPATIDATVLHNGVPLVETTFRLDGDLGDTGCGWRGIAEIDARTDADGRVTIKVCPGIYTVRWPFAADERIAVPAGSHLAQTFAMRSGTIHLVLRDTAGQPAGNCTVVVKNGAGELVRQGSTDAQGRVDLPVPVGVLQLSWRRAAQGPEALPPVSLGNVVVGQGEVVNVDRTLPPGSAR